MSKWGAEHFSITSLNFKGVGDFSLEGAVKLLPSRVKQAFYAAIVRNGTIRRRTWNGCAFNAGSLEKEFLVNDKAITRPTGVDSHLQAATAFGISEALVKRFISAWDGYHTTPDTDEQATLDLLAILETVGVFTEPDTPNKRIFPDELEKKKSRLISDTVYVGNMTDAQIIDEMLADLSDEFSVLLDQAEGLLIGAGV